MDLFFFLFPSGRLDYTLSLSAFVFIIIAAGLFGLFFFYCFFFIYFLHRGKFTGHFTTSLSFLLIGIIQKSWAGCVVIGFIYTFSAFLFFLSLEHIPILSLLSHSLALGHSSLEIFPM